MTDNIIQYFMPPHINIYFEDKNSDKSCKILSNRIIKEIERVYRKLDEFEEDTLKLNLTTKSYKDLITNLKRLKNIKGVNSDLVPLQYFLSNILDF